MFEEKLHSILREHRIHSGNEITVNQIKTLIEREIEACPVIPCNTSKDWNIIEWSHAVVKRDLKSRLGIKND